MSKDLRALREIADLRAQTPVRVGALTPSVPIIIIGGQSMGTFNSITSYGIEKYVGTLAGVTTQTYSPGTVNPTTGAETSGPSPAISAWPSGLGYGTLCIRGYYSRVIVCNDSRGGCANVLMGGASDDTTYVPSARQVTIIASRQVAVTKADGTVIRAWSPDLG